MHLSPAMSSVTRPAQRINSGRVSYLSMELVDAAFNYKKEILQLRQEQEMAVAKKNNIAEQNKSLYQQKLEIIDGVLLLEIEKERIKTGLSTKKIKIRELKEISSDLVHNPMRGRPIPNDVLLKCKHLIDAEDQLEANR